MKRLLPLALPLLVCASTVVCASAFAIEVDQKLERAVHDALPVCAGGKVTFDELPIKLPPRFNGHVVRVSEGDSGHCGTQLVAVMSPAGRVYVGSPWPIDRADGATIEEKLQSFTLANLQEQMTAKVDRTRTPDGLFSATLTQTTEAGKMTIDGEVDPEGRIFFMGHFRPAAELRAARVKTLEPFLANMPAKGAASAPVTIIEFSDFQCPSCKRSSGYVDPILARHGEKVRYIRYDLPLTGHAWAFPAALAGRAIYRQNPALFWTYKKQVYENQDKLIAFTFWDWARNFATDNDLDLAKYDADLSNETIKAEILRGAGVALSNDVRSTPSYLVNGTLVEAGHDGKALAEYVDGLVK